jgi:F-type H+-transporting ATPase subunit delta
MATDVGLSLAKSIYRLAKERNSVEEVGRDLETLAQTIESDKRLILALKHPFFTADQKVELLNIVSGNELVKIVVRVLLQVKQFELFNDVSKHFIKFADKEAGIVPAEVSFAIRPTQDQAKRVQLKLEELFGKKIRMHIKTDKSLIGGFTVAVEGNFFDESFKKRLAEIKEQVLQQ